MRLALALGLALALVARAAAAEAPRDPGVELERAYTEGRYSAALRLGSELVAEDPDDAGAHYYYGLTLADVGDLGAATAALQRAHALLPDEPSILYALARTVSDEKVAREHLAAAAGLAPDDPQRAVLIDHFDTLDRGRRRVRGEFAAGSPEAALEQTLTMLEDGRRDQAVRDRVARSTIARIVGAIDGTASSEVSERDLRGFAAGLDAAWTAEASQLGRYEGFRVMPADPAVPPGATSARLEVRLVLARQFTARQVATIRRAHADPATRGLIDPQLARLLDGLDPADEEAMLQRMIARPANPVPLAMQVDLVREAADWKVADFALGELTLTGVFGRYDELTDKGIVRDGRRRRRDWYRLGQGVGRVVGIAVGLAVVLWLIARGRRRAARMR